MKKAVVFMADGTEESEALLVIDLLRRAKVEVTVASTSGSLELLTSHKIKMQADALLEDINYAEIDLLVLPGGVEGTANMAANGHLLNVLRSAAAENKKIAAICAAPSILGHLGLLKGHRATSHAKYRDQLTGATVLDQEVVVDGNFITSFGLGGGIAFGLELVTELAGKVEADRIRQAIEYIH